METTVFGKWILAGEHAVLRGCPAVVFPAFTKSLKLRFDEALAGGANAVGDFSTDSKGLAAEFSGEYGSEMRLLFWGVVEKALEMTGRSRLDVAGRFQITNSIPVGAGLGASAALCVAIGRWFQWRNWIAEPELAEFCRQLENLFHGESSGVDIAVAISGQGLHYERGGERYAIQPAWEPDWYLSFSGKRGVTSECIARVKALWTADARLGERIDRDMCEAVLLAESALSSRNPGAAFEELAAAINRARGCFERWGLASGEMGAHMQMLLNHGASAVKPTGSGDGGYVLSLWRTPPPMEVRSRLISLKCL